MAAARKVATVACALCLTFAALPSGAHAQPLATVWAVGDGAIPESTDDAVAALVGSEPPNAFLYLGDVYERGTASEFQRNYDTAFGRFKAVTYPTPGNHEWLERSQGYDLYWGPRVRQPDGGHWYSFDLAGWHFVSLSSMEATARGSPQETWLRNDLARYPGSCTVVFTHYPRFSAGPQYNTPRLEPLFAASAGRAVAWLSGHAHNYQRLWPTRGITQFVVGTGGRAPSAPDRTDPRVAAAFGGVAGALRLRLGVGELAYAFVAIDGRVLDTGTLECRTHSAVSSRLVWVLPRDGSERRTVRRLAGRVAYARRVSLTLVRRVGARCEALGADTRGALVFARASCRTRRYVRPSFSREPLAASGRFDLQLPSRLPPGAYRLTVSARSPDGRLYRSDVRFRVRP